jgi:D-alanine--D-alanine ligase
MKIALICGGPSLERGISLNSARSVMDHLGGENVEIVPIYFDHKKRPYSVSLAQLYSNTPSDFDFKLKETAKKLSQTALKKLIKSTDLVFPVMHGAFGEGGQIQKFLERLPVPFVGSSSEACRKCFDKFNANEFLKEKGFFTLPSCEIKIGGKNNRKIVQEFFSLHKIKRAIIKPAQGGSSIGVFSVSTVEEVTEKAKYLFNKRMDTRLVVEPFCTGTEFTVIILQNKFGMPVAVLPTEIETDYTKHQIFDYRKKYLPTRQVKYHCPPRFSNEIIEKIQVQAEQIFVAFGMRDFARFDGWVMPDGNIWFSDFNPISGMEQNSFLFQQGSRIGFSHRDLLKFVVKNACRREGVLWASEERAQTGGKKKLVQVLFGGNTSERQVSLMSGTNAWLKLRRSWVYEPKPFLLDLDENVWLLPYAFTLNHTVEEILGNCKNAEEGEARLKLLEEKVRLRLALENGDASEPMFLPKKMSLAEFIKSADFVFVGLHGGIGEDGTLQKMLEKAGKKFNGSRAKASALCMDKWETGLVLSGMEKEGIFVSKKQVCSVKKLSVLKGAEWSRLFSRLKCDLGGGGIIVKPKDEGCSSGIVKIKNVEELKKYVECAIKGVERIPLGTFSGQNGIIEMPPKKMKEVLFEEFVETDKVRVKGNRLKWNKKTGWIEVTCAVLEENGKYHSFSPSLTVAEGEVLTVEEKFQGGTGVNMTPPPAKIVKENALKKTKKLVEKVAERLGIEGYARIDMFMNVKSGNVIVLEANTTPALTPSTVFFHQALAEKPALYPTELLEKLIKNKGYK